MNYLLIKDLFLKELTELNVMSLTLNLKLLIFEYLLSIVRYKIQLNIAYRNRC